MNWASIELLVLDVDGVLTDGRILSSAEGGWEKSFYVQDGCATKLWSRSRCARNLVKRTLSQSGDGHSHEFLQPFVVPRRVIPGRGGFDEAFPA